ncbi:helix-turn-helix domain-containing protein [Streptomyces sp. S1D4-11]|nr:helix-turn-helix transcriptional regulator [Streptomyces sp. S1D4-11]QIY95648.1 helix-turn-helix transcriptional regulator [Streptomyces sp. S1D4-11]
MSTLYERVASTDDGIKRLAVGRLKREVLRALHLGLKASGLTQSELASRLKIRKSAVNQVLRGDGNLRVQTVAEYLHALGYELDVRLVAVGEPRRAVLEGRDVVPAFPTGPAPTAQPVPSVEHSVHVVDTGSSHLLIDIRLQQDANPGTVRFEGAAHQVPKAPLPTSVNELDVVAPHGIQTRTVSKP